MTTSLTPDQAADLADQAAPLDALLIDAALGVTRGFAPDLSTAKAALGLARRPAGDAARGGLAGGGHLFVLENPPAVARQVADFLTA